MVNYNEEILIDNIRYRYYDKNYLVSEYGDVFSLKTKTYLKYEISWTGHHRVQLYGRIHMPVHRLVYMLFVDVIPDEFQINHIDDNKDNNHYSNLYLGTQKDNVQDSIRNNTRVGNYKKVTVFDKKSLIEIVFNSILELIEYTGHSCSNGSLVKLKTKKWFNDRFDIIKTESVKKKSVTTRGDECSPVE